MATASVITGGVNGAFQTNNGWPASSPVINNEMVKNSFPAMITRLMPNGAAPLFGLTSMLKSQKAVQIEHGFFAKIMLFPQATINNGGALATGTTTIPVTSSSQLIPGMLLKADSATTPTSEVMLVLSVPTATSVVVQRNVAGSAVFTPVSIADGTVLYQIGNAQQEASNRPQSLLTQSIRVTNLTQIFRNTWTISDTVRATEMLVGDSNIAESRQECAAYHAMDIEKAMFFGVKTNGTVNGQPYRAMNGLLAIISDNTTAQSLYPGAAGANVYSCASTAAPNAMGATIGTASATAGQINWTDLSTYLESTLNQATDPKGSNDRVIFCGGKFISVVMRLVAMNSEYEVSDSTNFWGLNFRTLKTARGTFRMIEHPLFNSNARWTNAAVVLDLSCIGLAYLGDRQTKSAEFGMDKTPVDNGIDAVGGTLTTECTLEVRNPSGCAIIWNAVTPVTG